MRKTDAGLYDHKVNFTGPFRFEYLLREERSLQSSLLFYISFETKILRNNAALWLTKTCTLPMEIKKQGAQSLRMEMLTVIFEKKLLTVIYGLQ